MELKVRLYRLVSMWLFLRKHDIRPCPNGAKVGIGALRYIYLTHAKPYRLCTEEDALYSLCRLLPYTLDDGEVIFTLSMGKIPLEANSLESEQALAKYEVIQG